MTKTTNKTIIGIVISDSVAEHIAMDIDENNDNQEIEYQITSKKFIEQATHLGDIYDKVESLMKENGWHYTVILTELPLLDHKHVIAIDLNQNKTITTISMPAFAFFFIKKKVKETMLTVIKYMMSQEEIVNLFPYSKTQTTQVKVQNKEEKHERIMLSNTSHSYLKLFSSMILLNNPFNMISSLSRVVAIAFTTGAFGMMFSTLWSLATSFEITRLLLINLVAIISMVAWIMIAHNLWQSPNILDNKKIYKLYNYTTVSTLTIAIVVFYLILFLMFLTLAFALLPSEFLSSELSLDDQKANLSVYFRIAWFAASISTFAGAIGAGLESRKRIRESTYGFRHYKGQSTRD